MDIKKTTASTTSTALTDKTKFYWPKKYQERKNLNLNGFYPVPDTDTKAGSTHYVCRHLATLCAEMANEKNKWKNDDFFATIQNPWEAQKALAAIDFENFILHSLRQPIKKSELGTYFDLAFEALEKDGLTGGTMLIITKSHVLAASLRIKKTSEDVTQYAIRIMDPNASTSHMRQIKNNSSKFETQFIDSNADLNNLPSVFTVASKNIPLVQMSRAEGRWDGIDPSHLIGHVAFDGLANDIKLFKRFSHDERRELLHSCYMGNQHPLYLAMSNGNASVVAALIDLMRDFSDDERVAVMACKAFSGTPGLTLAFKEGHTETVRAFCNAIKDFPQAERMELLACKSSVGVPGLLAAIYFGHTETVQAFYDGITDFPKAERMALLSCKMVDGTPGLAFALGHGHTKFVLAFCDAIKNFPLAERMELLACKNADGVSGLYLALQNGHTETVRAFSDAIKYLPIDERMKLLAC